MSQDVDNLEIVVSDNSEGTAREMVSSFRDPRIRYVQPPDYLPMSAHWDFVAQNTNGDMVMFIGDDDGLMPEAIAKAKEIVNEFGFIPIHHTLVQYGWPDHPNASDRSTYWFIHPMTVGTGLESSEKFLTELCAGQNLYSDGPMLYHGFVPKTLLNRLSKNGSIFHRSSPDVYTAITLAAHASNYVKTSSVLSVSGVGARSNGVATRNGSEVARQFVNEMKVPKYVSRFKGLCISLHVLDSILEAIEQYGLTALNSRINAGQFFCRAANECLDNPVRIRGIIEMTIVLAEAARNGQLGYLLRDRGGRILELAKSRAQRESNNPDRTENAKGWEPAHRYKMPSNVIDVAGAAEYLQRSILAAQY